MTWRKVWKPKTRGGHEVLFVAQCPRTKDWHGIYKEGNGSLSLRTWHEKGLFLPEKEHEYDLIPAEPDVYEFECEWNENGAAVFFGTKAKYIRTIDKLKGKRTRVRVEVINDEDEGE